MKLARRHTAALILGILIVMAGYAYMEVRHEVVLFEADFERTRRLGRVMLLMLEEIWKTEGEARMRQLLEQADATVQELHLRTISLAPPDGDSSGTLLSAHDREALAAGQIVRTVHETANHEQWRYTYVPLTIGETRPAAVEVAESLQRQLSFIRTSHRGIALATVSVVAVCALIVIGLDVWFVGRPLQRLRDKTRRAGQGDLSGPLVLEQHDEIGELASEINTMCERIAEGQRKLAAETEARITALEQLRHTDRLATVGQLAAGVAHELGTPLSVASARAQLIASTEMPHRDAAQNAQIIVEQADRMTAIIQQLLDFSRRRGATLETADLEPIVAHTLEMLSSVARRAGVHIHSQLACGAERVRVDGQQIQQALTNVVLNGIQAMPKGGELYVRIFAHRGRPPDAPNSPERGYLCIAVADEGSGMSADQMAHIFEPFYTTKPVGEGTGLGLAVAHGIIAEHGGWIGVESELGKGSRFSVYVPQAVAVETASSGVGV
jgi:two-component system NtrC family sensor kinase